MFRELKILLLTFALVSAGASAQTSSHSSSSTTTRESGLYESSTFSTGRDSSAGWSAALNSAIGYDAGKHLSFELGVPFYLVTTSTAASDSTTTTANQSTSKTGSLGDVFARLFASASSDALDYSTAFTLTAPTGDTSAGISTGRSTFTWDNRVEHDFSHITPFAEGSFGNSLGSSLRYMRSYTTLGAASEFRGGAAIDLLKHASIEASAYGDVGYGSQKVYSHQVGKGASMASVNANAGKHGRAFETAYVTSGTGSLVNDHGLTADLSVSPTARLGFDLAYNHSSQFAIDSVEFTVGVRLGHIPRSANNN